MEYNYFKKAGLLVLENEGKKSLYRFTQKNTNNVEPIAKLSNQTRLEIYPDDNLIVADSQILTLNLKPIHNCESYFDVTLTTMDEGYTLIKISAQQLCFLLFWSKKKLKNVIKNCLDVHYNNRYVAVKTVDEKAVFSPIWQIYTAGGDALLFAEKNRIHADNVLLKGNFLITDGLANHDLYWLPTRERLIEKQQRIVAAEDFALCGDISGTVQLYHRGKWQKFDYVQDFDIVAEKCGIFFLRRNERYFLYWNDGSPLLQGSYPEGFDAVSYHEKDATLLFIINNNVNFYH